MVDKGEDSFAKAAVMLFVIYAMYFFLPMVVLSKGYKYANLLKFIGPLSCLMLKLVRDGFNNKTLNGFVYMINYDLVFMMQGMVDQIFYIEQKHSRNDLSKTMLTPFMFFSLKGVVME